jgi:hypothetical protein
MPFFYIPQKIPRKVPEIGNFAIFVFEPFFVRFANKQQPPEFALFPNRARTRCDEYIIRTCMAEVPAQNAIYKKFQRKVSNAFCKLFTLAVILHSVRLISRTSSSIQKIAESRSEITSLLQHVVILQCPHNSEITRNAKRTVTQRSR